MATQFTCVWEFLVAPGQAADFERHYGPKGSWVALFRHSPGYLGTQLLKDQANPLRFITVDRWASAQAYQAFQTAFHRPYAELDATCRALTVSETSLGMFDEAGA